VPGKVEDVADVGAAEAVDALGVVSHHGEAAAVGLHGQQDGGLQAVGVLVFIHQHVAEALAHVPGQRRFGHHLRPVEQKVVVVEHLLGLLGLYVGAEQGLQVTFPACTPGKAAEEHFRQGRAGIHGSRVDGQAGALEGKTLALCRQPQFVTNQVHQIGGVFPVVDGEGRVEADAPGKFTQQAGAHAVKGAGPRKATAGQAGVAGGDLGGDALHAPGHLVGSAPGKGEQQDPPGVGTLGQQVGDPMGEGIGFAGARAGDDQQRAVVRPGAGAMERGGTLGVVEGVKVGGAGGRGRRGAGRGVHGCSFAVILYSKRASVNPWEHRSAPKRG
jgi:hypothetical protein